MLDGDNLHEITFNGEISELKFNSDLLWVNLNSFEHRFSITTCASHVSKSTGQIINPFALNSRWLAFTDKKSHSLLNSIGGVSMEVEQSYISTVFNTAKVNLINFFKTFASRL